MLIVAHIERTHRRRELPELFIRVREAGFDGVEVVVGAGCTCELSESEEDCHALTREAERSGIPVRSALLADDPAVRLGVANERERLRSIEAVRAVVRRCRWLGVRTLRLIPAVAGVGPDGNGLSYQETLNQTWRSLEALRGDFERCGVVAGVMPCHHRFLLSPPEFRELIDRVNSSLVGAALDWDVCARIGSPADWITTLQHRLAAVSLGAAAWNMAVGDQTWLRALRDIRFDGLLICPGEPCNPDELKALRKAIVTPGA